MKRLVLVELASIYFKSIAIEREPFEALTVVRTSVSTAV